MRIRLPKATCFLMLLTLSSFAAAQQSAAGPPEDKVSSIYKEPNNDPFKSEIKIRPTEQRPPEILQWPVYEEREFEWKKRRDEARKKGLLEPSPSERYLIDEMLVMGVVKRFEERIALLKPKTAPGTVIFAKAGQKFYNGSIKRIESEELEFEETTKMSNKTVKTDYRRLRFTRGK